MGIALSPAEQALYDKQITDQPAEVIIPNEEDILNGAEVEFVQPSGIQQDIDANDSSIIQTNTELVKNAEEKVLILKFTEFFHDIIRNYETEVKALTGVVESSPWQIADMADSVNIYHGVTSRYFPSGTQQNPMQAVIYAEVLGNGGTTSYANNETSKISSTTSLTNTHVGSYSNGERESGNYVEPEIVPPTPEQLADPGYVAPTPPPTGLSLRAIVFTEMQSLKSAIQLDVDTLSGSPDDTTPEAIAATAARLIVVSDYNSRMQGFINAGHLGDSVTVPMLSMFSEMAGTRTTRLSEINTVYLLSSYYQMRSDNAIGVVEFGEGLTFKILQGQSSLAEMQRKKVTLQRKLQTYEEMQGFL